jgi:hypothetical protein
MSMEEVLLELSTRGVNFRPEGSRLLIEVPEGLSPEWHHAIERHARALHQRLRAVGRDSGPCPDCQGRVFSEACVSCTPPAVGARVTLSWHVGSA